MSEEEDSFLNVRRSMNKTAVKHSTPVDSVFSQSMLSLDLTNESFKEQDTSKKIYGSPMAKPFQEQQMHLETRISQVIFPRRLSTVLDSEESKEEMSHSSRIIFPRRRLSTVLASEESNEGPSYEVILPTSVKEEAEVPAEPPKKKVRVTSKHSHTELVTGIPGIKDPTLRRRRKKKFEKELVKEIQNSWELRQLKNIEEATRHNLTIEEV
ncbi:PREDICTED: uncharacterized protein LOC109291901 [Gavialis gangeticus]|uniref:uncharacterized protein LOC109291901 n=1 Tax=Gavialis gangeticus TaxID=94835 RepID=UPI00092EE430|nr:PREDICTED: uncharacterized protein LOC109291901 [Gavialis gangeticus]